MQKRVDQQQIDKMYEMGVKFNEINEMFFFLQQ